MDQLAMEMDDAPFSRRQALLKLKPMPSRSMPRPPVHSLLQSISTPKLIVDEPFSSPGRPTHLGDRFSEGDNLHPDRIDPTLESRFYQSHDLTASTSVTPNLPFASPANPIQTSANLRLPPPPSLSFTPSADSHHASLSLRTPIVNSRTRVRFLEAGSPEHPLQKSPDRAAENIFLRQLMKMDESERADFLSAANCAQADSKEDGQIARDGEFEFKLAPTRPVRSSSDETFGNDDVGDQESGVNDEVEDSMLEPQDLMPEPDDPLARSPTFAPGILLSSRRINPVETVSPRAPASSKANDPGCGSPDLDHGISESDWKVLDEDVFHANRETPQFEEDLDEIPMDLF